jgi:hypothetical protein
VKHAGTTLARETVSGTSGSSELSPGGGSTEMISDGCTDPNGKVLIERVGEHLLPAAQASGLWRPGLPVVAPGAGNRHIDLFGHLIPGQASVAQLQDLLCRGGMSGRAAATHRDAGLPKLMVHGGPGNDQLGTDPADPRRRRVVGDGLRHQRLLDHDDPVNVLEHLIVGSEGTLASDVGRDDLRPAVINLLGIVDHMATGPERETLHGFGRGRVPARSRSFSGQLITFPGRSGKHRRTPIRFVDRLRDLYPELDPELPISPGGHRRPRRTLDRPTSVNEHGMNDPQVDQDEGDRPNG